MDTSTPDTPLPHGSIQTTTGTAEPAPEVLLTRGYAKRSLAAIEPEFVDSSDINGMAPSSAVLQADYLIMDDAHNLDDRYDMAPKANALDPPRDMRLSKRVRYTDDSKLTASDFAHLEPIITPKDEHPSMFIASSSSSSPSGLFRKSSSSSSSTGHPHTQSRKRSIADLVPPSSSQEPVYLDETRAINEYGEPVDSSAASLAMDLSGYGPGFLPRAPHEFTEFSGMIKTKVVANSTNDTLRLKEPISTASPAPSSSSSSTTTSKSPLFLPPSHSSRPHLPHQDSCSSNNGSTDAKRTTPARKNSIQRPVRIQLLDEQESETLDQARRASADQLDEEDEDEKHHGVVSHDTASFVQKKKRTGVADDIALPPEDPIMHDWDKEELDDEDDDSNYGSQSDSVSSSPRRRDPVYRKRKSIEEDIRRAAGEGDHRSHHRQRHHLSNAIDDDDDDDDDDERRDSLHGDPERDIAVMSEDQEADLHNVHLRLENQREFQDAAGLDLGEGESESFNDDGRYGGAIEDDDEGEDFWENR
ncbi:hypothetical protein BG006_007829 [Podila minutissima]|uniref:Uncharacterized protein n=1 Tax=Podila minutissima TaxID=64525 RepID=A0A9P5SJC7_9FUNG|nr:hypothetical protein BG006_007829 [Podila minutissima]